jgi:hypothetical protein
VNLVRAPQENLEICEKIGGNRRFFRPLALKPSFLPAISNIETFSEAKDQ